MESRALVMAFKSMKDHIVSGMSIAGQHETVRNPKNRVLYC